MGEALVVGVKITCDFNKALTALGEMAKGDFTVPLTRMGQRLVRSTAENFKNEQSPDGEPWKPLAGITKALRRRGKKNGEPKILQDSGRLRNSVTSQVTMNIDKTSLEFGTNVEYGKTHQYGGPSEITVIRKKNQRISKGKNAGKYKKRYITKGVSIATAYTKTIQVPARPFLGVKEADKEVFKKILKDWYKEIFNGA